jgi:hypothetical protein
LGFINSNYEIEWSFIYDLIETNAKLIKLILQNNNCDTINTSKNNQLYSILQKFRYLQELELISWKMDECELKKIHILFQFMRQEKFEMTTTHTEVSRRKCLYTYNLKMNTKLTQVTLTLNGLNNEYFIENVNMTMFMASIYYLSNVIYFNGLWCNHKLLYLLRHESGSMHTLTIINPNEDVTYISIQDIMLKHRRGPHEDELKSFTYRGKHITNADFICIFTTYPNHYFKKCTITYLNMYNENIIDVLTTQMILDLLKEQTQLEHLITHNSASVNKNEVMAWIVKSGRNIMWEVQN